jgi:dolichyl-phosphate beta-glucosyltransferase
VGHPRPELLGARTTAPVTAPSQIPDTAPTGALPTLVVPCYNEQFRLDLGVLEAFAGTGGMRLLFVDDGSVDGTAEVLADLAAHCPGRAVEILHLPCNLGKGEAVRAGLRDAIRSGSEIVGYFDADLSTPPTEVLRLVDTLAGRPDLEVVLGSRIARLGSTIERTARRHLLGRVFATAASVALGCQIYDTQCGAKVFRVTPALTVALQRPFRSAWAFDVELLKRLLTGGPTVAPVDVRRMLELPLNEWTETRGSHLRVVAMAGAFADVCRMAGQRQYRRISRRGRP